MLCASKAKEEQTRLRIDRALIPVRFSFGEMAYNKRGGEGSLHHIKHMLELPGGCNKASSVLCYTHTHTEKYIMYIYICRFVGRWVCVSEKEETTPPYASAGRFHYVHNECH